MEMNISAALKLHWHVLIRLLISFGRGLLYLDHPVQSGRCTCFNCDVMSADTFLPCANGVRSSIALQQHRKSQVSQPAGHRNQGDTGKPTGASWFLDY